MGEVHVCRPTSLRGALKNFVVKLAVAATIAAVSIAGGRDRCAMAATVLLSPRNNIQNAVNANPAGTTFILQRGVYRNNGVVSLRNGDRFIGQPGAILNGSKVLTSWTRVSINGIFYWTRAGGTPQGNPNCTFTFACCESGYPRCMFPQDLYVNNIHYRLVASLAKVVAGRTWYWDFSGTDGGIKNNIYLAADENPNSNTVELGKVTYAFKGIAANITIQNLTIEKYAVPIQKGAIDVSGLNWLIQDNEVRLNHGEGISAHIGADNIQVLGNNVHNNGEMGISVGGADGGLFDSNEIAKNNTDRVSTNFEGGGTKFTGSYIMISNNVAHDNYGVGLFTDTSGTYNTYDSNTSYHNYAGGIRYEISRYGTITNNTVYGNYGKNPGIVYTGSDHGRISGNTVIDNGYGTIEVWNTLGTVRSIYPVYQVTDTQVTNNTIYIPTTAHEGVAVGFQDFGTPLQPRVFSDPTNFFDYNIYQFQSLGRPIWHWGETSNVYAAISWATWRADGQDPNGTLRFNVSPPNP